MFGLAGSLMAELLAAFVLETVVDLRRAQFQPKPLPSQISSNSAKVRIADFNWLLPSTCPDRRKVCSLRSEPAPPKCTSPIHYATKSYIFLLPGMIYTGQPLLSSLRWLASLRGSESGSESFKRQQRFQSDA